MAQLRRAGGRYLRWLALTGCAVAVLAACGGNPAASPGVATDAPGATGAFPVQIQHKFGTTTIPATPKRVVSIGYTEQDALLALGVVPVGIREWFGNQPSATWSWARSRLGGAKPTVLDRDTLNFEQIAALHPDLIVGMSSGMTAGDYAKLSQIAPTLAQSAAYPEYRMPWQEVTTTIGRAVGRGPQAEALVAGVQAQFAAARQQHPEFAGKTGVVAEGDPGTAYAHVGDQLAGFLTELGFVTPQPVAKLVPKDDVIATISDEQLGLLDTDVLVWIESSGAKLNTNPVYQRLRVAREGRDVFLTGDAAGALSFSSVLSLPYALDRVVPMLAAAVDGNPATKVVTSSG